jgi:hypothetical protein
MQQTEEGVLAVVISIAVALLGSLFSYVSVCAEQHACLKAGTCYALSNSSFRCGFKNSITPAGWRLLNMTNQRLTLQTMNRGICSPGLRQSVDPFSGEIECVRKRSYPDALINEIGDPDATSDHQRWCGKWIDAGNVVTGDLKWAFFDSASVKADVDDVILAKGSGRLGTTDVGKFRTACRSMVASNSAGPAGQVAFEHLDAQLHAVFTLEQALKAIGFLGSHFCDGPATLALTYQSSGFVVNLSTGVRIDGETLREALYGVGADHGVRDHAAEYAEAMEAVPVSEIDAISNADVRAIVRGSHEGTWVDAHVGASFPILRAMYNPSLARFVRAFVHSEGGAARAKAYLRGLAAYCSYAARSVVTGEFGGVRKVEATARQIRANNAPAAALGRLRGSGLDVDRFARADAHTMLNASKVTLSSLTASGVAGAARGNARASCLRAARVAFPDEFDHIAFNALVTKRLYDRLETLNTDVKNALDATLQAEPIRSLFASNANRDFTVSMLRQTRLRIAGAPRNTWGGVSRTFTRPVLTSEDGALLILLKQARAVYLDRLYKAVAGVSVCEHPPLYDALERNAYLLMSSGFSCAMVLPGLIVPPFADERYDDASLQSRVGYVMSHEYAHVTAFTELWNLDYADTLLADYQPETHIEAVADLAGVEAILRLGKVDNESLCGHVSQLWCGRRGWLDGGGDGGSHPRANERGDRMCAFLRRQGAVLAPF